MNFAKLLSTVGWTVINGDSSIVGWRLLGFSYLEAVIITIIITNLTAVFLYLIEKFCGKWVRKLIEKRRAKRGKIKRNNRDSWHVHRRARASLYKSKKRLDARVVKKYGLRGTVCVAAAWPTILLGPGVHHSTLFIISQKDDKGLLVAYLIGNALRIIYSGTSIQVLVWIWHAIF